MASQESRSFKLDDESFAHFRQTEESIAHFSIQLGRAILQVDEMKSGLNSLYLARQQLINRVLEAGGVNPQRVMNASLDAEGVISVLVASEEPKPTSPAPVA